MGAKTEKLAVSSYIGPSGWGDSEAFEIVAGCGRYVQTAQFDPTGTKGKRVNKRENQLEGGRKEMGSWAFVQFRICCKKQGNMSLD